MLSISASVVNITAGRFVMIEDKKLICRGKDIANIKISKAAKKIVSPKLSGYEMIISVVKIKAKTKSKRVEKVSDFLEKKYSIFNCAFVIRNVSPAIGYNVWRPWLVGLSKHQLS
jgi:hypothetical protein